MENLFQVKKIGEKSSYLMVGDKLKLKAELDPNSSVSMESQLFKLLSKISKADDINNIKKYVESALLDKNSREKKYVWIRKDLISDNKIDYSNSFERLNNMADKGYPAVIYNVIDLYKDKFVKNSVVYGHLESLGTPRKLH